MPPIRVLHFADVHVGMENYGKTDPEAGGARRFCEALKDEGLLCKETHDNVVRFAPPLTITKPDIDWALERIEKVMMMP